jgi:aminoglycoside phosphotransferase family enzyme/predicted kinase
LTILNAESCVFAHDPLEWCVQSVVAPGQEGMVVHVVSTSTISGSAASKGEAEQAEAVAFLSNTANLPGAGPVETIRTHCALVFLAGPNAYKIKRAVRYDYLDYSTLEQRRQMLLRELELNTPQAPEIYRDVIALSRGANGQLTLGGNGQPIEWVLRMSRFDTDKQLDRIVDQGALTDALTQALSEAVVTYHTAAPDRRQADGANLISAIVDELNHAFADMGTELGANRIDEFRRATARILPHLDQLLRQRAWAGHVRRFHGDLHLRNVALVQGRPVLFDALEFDETLGTGDVLYDLAFLVMDLLHRGQHRSANIVLNSYLASSAEPDHETGLAAFPLFLGIRAAIRAMVVVQTGVLAKDSRSDPDDARAYLDQALAFLAPAPIRLIAVGGLSGTGKTTVAAALAPSLGRAPGAVHLRSDLERKRLFGVDAAIRLPAEAYSQAISAQVHTRMCARAERILRAGHSVVMDATYLLEADRAALAGLAGRVGVQLEGLWLDAPLPTLQMRVSQRKNDASDADAEVVRAQAVTTVPPLDWTKIDASGDPEAAVRAASASLSGQQGAAAPSKHVQQLHPPRRDRRLPDQG